MLHRFVLPTWLALLGCTGLAHAQAALGPPVGGEIKYEQGCADCKPKQTILGKLFSPIRALAGNMTPPPPSPSPPPVEVGPTKQDVARMIMDGGYSPAEITAAKIKVDESHYEARRAAVRYLGTVDCHYYPEAETGLIAALRADRAEYVRYEAAIALGNSRSLTDKMIEGLNMTALGLELDGNPAETSERVRNAARASLQQAAQRGLCLPPLASITPLWLPTEVPAIQQTNYLAPAHLPTTPPVSPQELAIAETVSTQTRPAPAIAAAPTRPFYQAWLNLTSGRDSARPGQEHVDPRLRGLAPLGSDGALAIPATSPSYNYR